MNIPFFNYPELFLRDESNLVEIFKDVGKRGAFIMQRDLEEFEDRLAEFTGAKYVLGVANATDGLQIGLMAGSSNHGGEVIFSSHTMVATASAIHFAGYTPVPVEAGSDLMINPKSVELAISDKTVAIMPTHLNGRTCNMGPLIDLANKYSLQIYEDAAQALGSKFKGKSAGTFGVASAISLYPAKILGCLGDGGAVLTNDEEVYRRIELLRDHGRDPETGEVISWGYNTRLDNLQAAFLNYFFSSYDEVISRRREFANMYDEGLSGIEELTLPEGPSDGDHFDVYQNYEIRALNRNKLKEFLGSKGIGSLVQWSGKAVHQFEELNLNKELPYTEKMFQELLMIPLNMFISNKDVKTVIDQIKLFYSSNTK